MKFFGTVYLFIIGIYHPVPLCDVHIVHGAINIASFIPKKFIKCLRQDSYMKIFQTHDEQKSFIIQI